MIASWLKRLFSCGSSCSSGQLTASCRIALNNISQRLLVADQAVKQATQPITNRGFFEVYIERTTQVGLDSASHTYYYDKELASAARKSAKMEHSAEVLHRHMNMLRKSLRNRLKDIAEKLQHIDDEKEIKIDAVFTMLDNMLAELIVSKEKAKESSARMNLRPKTQKQVELCFTQLDLAMDNLRRDLAPLKQALRDTIQR